MNEYIKTDVGEYLTGRTGSFEKSPPDELWKHIEENIPTYSAFSSNRTLLKYLIGGISLSGIIIAVILIYNQPITPFENKANLSDIKKSLTTANSVSNSTNQNQTAKTENITIASIEKNENISANKNIKTSESLNKKENGKSIPTNLTDDKSITYSINASGLKNVTSISFVNDKNETVLVSKNPVPNSFGFYIIDISQLPKGTYNIMIGTPEGSKLHKLETFK